MNGKRTKAAAPTGRGSKPNGRVAVGKGGRHDLKSGVVRGIAAANIEIEKTGVSATTIHNMFEDLLFS